MIGTDWFQRWALYSPDVVALKDDGTGRAFTYRQSHGLVNRLAHALRMDFGIRAGDRVAVLAMNELEYVFLFYALQKVRAILVPVNYRLAPPEVAHVLKDCSPVLLIYQEQFESTITGIAPACMPRAALRFEGRDSLLSRLYDTHAPAEEIRLEADLETPVMILYTSGTTGAPKGAIISHGMLFWNSVNTSLRLNITQADVTLIFAPFFHTGGWNVLTTPFLHRGGRLINMKKFDADRVLQLCESENVTILFGVPTMMDMLSRSPVFPDVNLTSLRYAIVGGEPMSLALIRIWQERGVPIRQGYGLTEFGPNVFSLNEADAIRKIGSIGFPNFYVDARVVDGNDAEVPPDTVGELVLRGPVCTPGYWNNPEATDSAIRNGWFHTGDLVRKDAEGYYYVVDRKKDMYISGAENVYPAEIELCLRSHPDVREVAVIGVPDERWGEVGKAVIALNPGAIATADEVLAFCSGRLAKFKIPKYVEFVDALPKSESGKILRRALRRQR